MNFFYAQAQTPHTATYIVSQNGTNIQITISECSWHRCDTFRKGTLKRATDVNEVELFPPSVGWMKVVSFHMTETSALFINGLLDPRRLILIYFSPHKHHGNSHETAYHGLPDFMFKGRAERMGDPYAELLGSWKFNWEDEVSDGGGLMNSSSSVYVVSLDGVQVMVTVMNCSWLNCTDGVAQGRLQGPRLKGWKLTEGWYSPDRKIVKRGSF